MISHLHRCVFVHLPKTGGTSIEVLLTGRDWITASGDDYRVYLAERDRYSASWGGTLCDRDPDYFTKALAQKHASQAELRARHGSLYDDYFKFAVVRNPWDRVLSIHAHGLRDAPDAMPAFREWLLDDDPRDHMGQPIWHQAIDAWDELDFVGHFESFVTDVVKITEAIGLELDPAELPHEHHGSHGRRHANRYDHDTRAIVATRCAEEIERFGYVFDEGAPASAPRS